jgi:hypothetical protein
MNKLQRQPHECHRATIPAPVKATDTWAIQKSVVGLIVSEAESPWLDKRLANQQQRLQLQSQQLSLEHAPHEGMIWVCIDKYCSVNICCEDTVSTHMPTLFFLKAKQYLEEAIHLFFHPTKHGLASCTW